MISVVPTATCRLLFVLVILADERRRVVHVENNVSVIRADVAGRADGIMSYGSSGIVDSHGNVLQSAQELTEELIVADLDVSRTASMAMR